MGAVATAVSQLNLDNTSLADEQAKLVTDQQAVTTDQSSIAGTQTGITTDDSAVVAALQSIQVAGQAPVMVYFPPDADGVQVTIALTPANPDGSVTPPGFTVGTAVPA